MNGGAALTEPTRPIELTGPTGPTTVSETTGRVPSRRRPRREARAELAPVRTAPKAAREQVSGLLRAWDLDDLEPVATLLTTELVTNVVLHGQGPIELWLSAGERRLRVVVTDRSAALPVLTDPDPDGEHGRGLSIVERMSTRWGCERCPGGKRVWFELES